MSLPVIDAAACVHGLSPQARCGDCIAACPHEALSLEGRRVRVDPDACAGCGACAAVCPQRAVTLERPPPLHQGPEVVIACSRHPLGAVSATPVCAQTHGLQQIAQWAAQGVRRIALATGDCDACPHRPATLLAERVAWLAPALAHVPQVGRAGNAEIAAWRRARDRLEAPARRRLFAAVLDAEAPAARPLAEAQRGGVLAFVPLIDAARCTGCDACVNLCPEAALLRLDDPPAYRAVPERCTGCLLCEDVCADGAIAVDGLAPPPPDLPLTAFRCRACGVTAQLPQRPADDLCPICRASPHHRKLFQVDP